MKKGRVIDYYASKAVRNDDDIFVAAADTETRGLGGELLMIQWGFMGEIFTDTSPQMVENFFNWIMDYPKPVVWFIHFAQYDFRYFLDYLTQNKMLVDVGMRTDTDVYELRIRRKPEDTPVILRDSYAIWPHPLKNLAEKFCPELPKGEIDVENFDPENPEHIAYARRDVEILLTGLPRLFDMILEHFRVNPSATVAGTSLKAWQRSLGKDVIYNCSPWGPQEQFVRQAYYGGLVFLTSNKLHKDCETYDLNSSYPASMCDYGVPYGRAAYTDDYMESRMGIYRCRVRAPEGLIVPILPARDKRGSMRWYGGEFETVCTNRELIFAANHGYEILEVYEGIVWEEIVYPYNDYIELCKFIRNNFKGQALEIVAKLMQNSLYGKKGSRRERLRMMNVLAMEEEDFTDAYPYDDSGNWYVRKELDENMRCLPEWAVFITAHSRLRLLQSVYKIGPENVLYGDTDSITVRKGFGHLLDVGDEYGQWKLEKEWREFRAIAPKVYSGVLQNGEFKGAAKGLPRKGITDQNWKELLEDGTSQATALSLDSLRVAMRKGVKPARQLIRVSSSLKNSMNFDALPNGDVRVKSKHGQNN